MTILKKRCAVYTRKSSEEGLEQEFNSLHAQRDSCLAYIASQKSEGWVALKEEYDDGGFSGGNMNRPGLVRLMADIKARRVDVVVVYKIDRLTRSLMDFSRLVEVFDGHGVTFVSVTQSFNTTTSMGRLTLNVLLSFAQFEREVTSERIRDKIAASKKKGIWMGGVVPLGYDVKDRHLIVNEAEAETVRMIYRDYLALGCVSRLQSHLQQTNIMTKVRTLQSGKAGGQKVYSRGALYHLLKSPIYLGKITHKMEIYEGNHDGIIDQELWDAVQKQVKSWAPGKVSGKENTVHDCPLKGKLFDAEGVRYTPQYALKNGKQYRYYISQNTIQGRGQFNRAASRIPAAEIENLIKDSLHKRVSAPGRLGLMLNLDADTDFALLEYLSSKANDLSQDDLINIAVKKIAVHPDRIEVTLGFRSLVALIRDKLNVTIKPTKGKNITMSIPYIFTRSYRGASVLKPPTQGNAVPDPFDLPLPEIMNLIRGHMYREEHFQGASLRALASRDGTTKRTVSQLITATL